MTHVFVIFMSEKIEREREVRERGEHHHSDTLCRLDIIIPHTCFSVKRCEILCSFYLVKEIVSW